MMYLGLNRQGYYLGFDSEEVQRVRWDLGGSITVFQTFSQHDAYCLITSYLAANLPGSLLPEKLVVGKAVLWKKKVVRIVPISLGKDAATQKNSKVSKAEA